MAVNITKEFEAEVEKLVFGENDILVVKSIDITPEILKEVREKFGHQVLGLGPNEEVHALRLEEGNVLVVKSYDIDVDMVRTLREKFNRKVIGLGPEDEVSMLDVKPETTIVLRGSQMPRLSVEVRADVEKYIKAETGCKGVLFLSDEVKLETTALEPRWCSDMNPCTEEKCQGGGGKCGCSCHVGG